MHIRSNIEHDPIPMSLTTLHDQADPPVLALVWSGTRYNYTSLYRRCSNHHASSGPSPSERLVCQRGTCTVPNEYCRRKINRALFTSGRPDICAYNWTQTSSRRASADESMPIRFLFYCQVWLSSRGITYPFSFHCLLALISAIPAC